MFVGISNIITQNAFCLVIFRSAKRHTPRDTEKEMQMWLNSILKRQAKEGEGIPEKFNFRFQIFKPFIHYLNTPNILLKQFNKKHYDHLRRNKIIGQYLIRFKVTMNKGAFKHLIQVSFSFLGGFGYISSHLTSTVLGNFVGHKLNTKKECGGRNNRNLQVA